MNRRLLAAAALVSLSACKKAPEPPKELPKSAFQEIADSIHLKSPCSKLLPGHWSPGFPVPALEDGKLAYKMFFFGRDGNPRDGFDFHEPEGWAVFTPEGQVKDCRRSSEPEKKIPRVPNPDITIEENVNRERRLYALTDRVGTYFAQGRELSAEGKQVVAEYAAAFKERADPAHLDDYRALSPAFWDWVEKNGGGKLQ